MIDVTIKDAANADQIADWIAQSLAPKLAEGPAAICVPGGSTPFPIFEALITMDCDWSQLSVWPGDDRIVPEDHAASNTGKIRSIFEPVGAKVMSLSEAETPPRFALCWMGMGVDGHIASLFPNTDPTVDDPSAIRRLTPDPLPPEAPFDRVTLTIPALLHSDVLMFVIRGEDKRAVFDAARRGENDLPISRLLRTASQPVTCFT